MLANVLKSEDELENRVILHLIDDEVFRSNIIRFSKLPDLLVGNDLLKLKSRLRNRIEHRDDLIEVLLNKKIELRH